ncbi:LEM domain-containing protein 2 isoform X2 [Amia ocellicauda]|uniref:LEM domain-containing protein 2 isoform X2 n=1 Tax=Amia ocellicauda TaxID=2972642 RepID=UPI0034647310
MASLSDEELRRGLRALGFCPGPISDSTRKLYLNKLRKLRATDRNRVQLLRSQGPGNKHPPQASLQRHRHDSHRQRTSSASPRHRTASFQRDSEESDEEDDDEYGYREETRYRQLADSGSSLKKGDAQRRCDSTARWNRFVERQLSRALLACTVALSVVLLWLVYVKTVGLGQPAEPGSNILLLPMDCKGKSDTYCRAEEKRMELQLLSELYSFLAKVAGDFECGNPSQFKSRCVSIPEVESYLATINKGYPSRLAEALQLIHQSDTDLGIWLVGKDPQRALVSLQGLSCVQSTSPALSLGCRLRLAVHAAILKSLIFILALAVMWGVLVLLRYRWRRLQEEEQAMYELVRRIIAAVREHYKDWDQGLEPIPYLPIPHVRDALLPPQNRRRMRCVWDKAVEFVASQESRIRTESHRVAGEDFLVWRWTQPAELSDSS